MNEPVPEQSPQCSETKEYRDEPSVIALVLRGVVIFIGAFISAAFIMQLHYPAGH